MISVERAGPVDLVDFACGATHWRLNSSAGDITYNGDLYKAQPGLMCGGIETARNVLRSIFEVTVPWSCDLAQEYVGGSPEGVVSVVNYRGHWGTPWNAPYERMWSGEVKDVRFKEGHKCVISCLSAHSDIGTTGLALRCGRLCQVPLFSSACGLTQASYTSGGIVSAVSGYTVTSPTFTNQALGYWVGGIFTARGASRFVIAHAWNVITLADAVPSLAINDVFTITAGCDRTLATCTSRFSNQANFRGQPHIPDVNPYLSGVEA